uniref:Uncharacterized protein n=1 Tax=Nelumbo nucifera TaxID=4432 RepID=A0A822YF67_NELNU|nr:TPA_asm: hypothetical protein HUJ06_029646 [Nelumbo nucifera]
MRMRVFLGVWLSFPRFGVSTGDVCSVLFQVGNSVVYMFGFRAS